MKQNLNLYIAIWLKFIFYMPLLLVHVLSAIYSLFVSVLFGNGKQFETLINRFSSL